jgi:hypothetical protein
MTISQSIWMKTANMKIMTFVIIATGDADQAEENATYKKISRSAFGIYPHNQCLQLGLSN